MGEKKKTDRCGLMFLCQEALSSLHNRGIRPHEGHCILLDLITEEQCSPANAHTHRDTRRHEETHEDTQKNKLRKNCPNVVRGLYTGLRTRAMIKDKVS